MAKRILIMAGGTGGHVFPGLAVADLLVSQGWQAQWLGTAKRMEANIVPKAGYAIHFIDVAGVRGNGIKRLLKAPLQIIKAIFQARRLIADFQPDVVLGMGGFASGPGGIAAWSMGVPLLLHEQNAVPGMTNKILAKFACRVLTGFENTFAQQQKQQHKFACVGNPVRAEFSALSPKQQPNSPLRILIVGGSLGAKALNDMVPKALENKSNISVRHQCGADHYDAVVANYTQTIKANCSWTVEEFIDDMAAAYHWADLVICRAGALTVAEVAASGVASIFVPLPHAVDDHQTKNAMSLSNQHAAYLLPQKELMEGGLEPIMTQIINNPQSLIDMGKRAKQLAKLQATKSVAEVCEAIVEKAA